VNAQAFHGRVGRNPFRRDLNIPSNAPNSQAERRAAEEEARREKEKEEALRTGNPLLAMAGGAGGAGGSVDFGVKRRCARASPQWGAGWGLLLARCFAVWRMRRVLS
jgi:hypothetical protein